MNAGGGLVRQPAYQRLDRNILAVSRTSGPGEPKIADVQGHCSVLAAEAQPQATVQDEAFGQRPGSNRPLAAGRPHWPQQRIVGGLAHSEDVSAFANRLTFPSTTSPSTLR